MTDYTAYEPIFQEIRLPLEGGFLFEATILREDLAHGYYQGNKWWKLKNNLKAALSRSKPTLVTFGGAYSNHIHATAAAGKEYGIHTVGIIRGEKPENLSPTLRFAQKCGMKLEFVSREAFRNKNTPEFLRLLKERFGDFHLVPEGGSNKEGFQGCVEWAKFLKGKADIFCIAAGTGTTAAAFSHALPEAEIWAVSALKGGHFLKVDAEKIAGSPLPNLQIITDYHFGGYAKHTPGLLDFIKSAPLPLEQVYTGKALFALMDLAKQGKIPAGKKICFIHTGGMQGKTL